MQNALHSISNGLYIIGAGRTPHLGGALVDAVTQISATPPLIMLSMMNTSHTLSIIIQNNEFSLSVLPTDTPPFVVANFGFQSGHSVDKWKEIDYELKDGLPYIKDSIAQIKFKLKEIIKYPNNTIIIAEPVKYYELNNKEPLTYKYYREHLKPLCQKAFGLHQTCKITSSPKEEGKTHLNHSKKWICQICYYEYEGDIPFEELDENWRCPYCGVSKDMFENI